MITISHIKSIVFFAWLSLYGTIVAADIKEKQYMCLSQSVPKHIANSPFNGDLLVKNWQSAKYPFNEKVFMIKIREGSYKFGAILPLKIARERQSALDSIHISAFYSVVAALGIVAVASFVPKFSLQEDFLTSLGSAAAGASTAWKIIANGCSPVFNNEFEKILSGSHIFMGSHQGLPKIGEDECIMLYPGVKDFLLSRGTYPKTPRFPGAVSSRQRHIKVPIYTVEN